MPALTPEQHKWLVQLWKCVVALKDKTGNWYRHPSISCQNCKGNDRQCCFRPSFIAHVRTSIKPHTCKQCTELGLKGCSLGERQFKYLLEPDGKVSRTETGNPDKGKKGRTKQQTEAASKVTEDDDGDRDGEGIDGGDKSSIAASDDEGNRDEAAGEEQDDEGAADDETMDGNAFDADADEGDADDDEPMQPSRTEQRPSTRNVSRATSTVPKGSRATSSAPQSRRNKDINAIIHTTDDNAPQAPSGSIANPADTRAASIPDPGSGCVRPSDLALKPANGHDMQSQVINNQNHMFSSNMPSGTSSGMNGIGNSGSPAALFNLMLSMLASAQPTAGSSAPPNHGVDLSQFNQFLQSGSNTGLNSNQGLNLSSSDFGMPNVNGNPFGNNSNNMHGASTMGIDNIDLLNANFDLDAMVNSALAGSNNSVDMGSTFINPSQGQHNSQFDNSSMTDNPFADLISSHTGGQSLGVNAVNNQIKFSGSNHIVNDVFGNNEQNSLTGMGGLSATSGQINPFGSSSNQAAQQSGNPAGNDSEHGSQLQSNRSDGSGMSSSFNASAPAKRNHSDVSDDFDINDQHSRSSTRQDGTLRPKKSARINSPGGNDYFNIGGREDDPMVTPTGPRAPDGGLRVTAYTPWLGQVGRSGYTQQGVSAGTSTTPSSDDSATFVTKMAQSLHEQLTKHIEGMRSGHTGEIGRLQALINQHQSDKDTLSRDIESLKSDKTQLRSEVDQANGRATALQSSKDELERTNTDLLARLNAAEARNAEVNKRVQELEQDITLATDAKDTATAQLAQAQAEISVLTKKAETDKSKMIVLNSSLERSNKKVLELREELQRKDVAVLAAEKHAEEWRQQAMGEEGS